MANSIEYAKKYVPIIDEVYKAASYTEGMDAATRVDFTGANEVKVFKVSTTGLGTYSRETGYPKGDVTAAWETMRLTQERGKELSIDRMDDEETLGLAFGAVTGAFMREHVVPELDAYRFAKYASTGGITKADADALDSDTILPAINEAIRQMNADEVPEGNRTLYISSDLAPVLSQAIPRQWGSDGNINTNLGGYNGIPIVYVPASRFYTEIALADGSAAWGYSKAVDGVNINFMLIYTPAILQVTKFALPKIFTPDENQEKDAWKFQFRLYHDAFVYENKAKGIYLHPATA